MQHSCFLKDVYVQRVAITDSPIPNNYNVMLPQELLLYFLVCSCINSMEVLEAVVSPPEQQAHLISAFLHVCLLSFLNLL
jgi:hypothetical protein